MALNHEEPDRVPINVGCVDAMMAQSLYEGLAELMELEPTAATAGHPKAYVVPDEKMQTALGSDVRSLGAPRKKGVDEAPLRRLGIPGTPIREERLPDGSVEFTYDGGYTRWRPAGEWTLAPRRPAITGELTRAEIDRLYPPDPKPVDWADAEAIRQQVDRLHGQGHAVVTAPYIMTACALNQDILGFERFCVELALNPKLVCLLLDRYIEHAFALWESFHAAMGDGVDVVAGLADDLASQSGLWMSPEDYRRYIKPRHKRIIRFIKEHTNAKIMYHFCGACRELIPDLIEIGVDVLTPTQTSAAGMDPFRLKKEFGDAISFWGGLDTQHVLPEGTVAEVEDEVKRLVDALAPGGGYVFGPAQIVQAEVPPENMLAMYRTALEYGRHGS
jgi:uroporphyrinogen decarboxylase